MNNFFTLFDQNIAFDIDLPSLDSKLHTLQKQYHPDNLSNAHNQSSDNQGQVRQNGSLESQSALINRAYQTLKYPDSRAVHLLEIKGQVINFNQSIADLDFLDDAMDIRVAIDKSIHEQNQQSLLALQAQLQNKIDEQANRFNQHYQQQSWQTSIDATQKLTFLAKIDRDIIQALDDIARNDMDSDDDLYV